MFILFSSLVQCVIVSTMMKNYGSKAVNFAITLLESKLFEKLSLDCVHVKLNAVDILSSLLFLL